MPEIANQIRDYPATLNSKHSKNIFSVRLGLTEKDF